MHRYMESCFQKEISFSQKLTVAFLFLTGGFVMIISFFLPIFFILGVSVLMAAFFMKHFFDQDIEYLLFDDEFEIYKIIHKRKRKKLYRADMKNMTDFIKYDPQLLSAYPKKYRKDFSGPNKSEAYMLLYKHQNERYCLLIQCDEGLLEVLKSKCISQRGV